jgi:multicomponent Na+:H+ antiporter subunit D
MAAFVVGGLSLIGVPGTVGLISKWYLVTGAFERGWWPVAILIMLSSLLAVVYIWRVVEVVFFHERPAHARPASEVDVTMVVPTWILIGGTVVFGIWADGTSSVALAAAASLLQGLP